VIYGIDTEVLRMSTGGRGDEHVSAENINKRLGTGEYTILQFVERGDKDFDIILGRLKEGKKT
jgi:hypothetical protein